MKRILQPIIMTVCQARVFAFLAVAVWLTPGSGWACVGCRQMTEEVKRTEPSTVMAGFAFSWSVLFMLVVVGVMISFLVTYMSRVVQRLNRNNELPPQ
jgi:hypothetical protein